MSLTEDLARDRRRLVLENLAAAPRYALGEAVLAPLVAGARSAVYRDQVAADIVYLTEMGLVTVTDLPSAAGPQREVTLTGLGLDVAGGRDHPAVAARLPRYL